MACSQQIQLPAQRALDRPDALELVCFELASGTPVALQSCDPDSADAEQYALHALITQTATGEVAPIQLTGEEAGVLDTDARIPGFTFVGVGDVPSAIVTPRANPSLTYVAGRGTSDVRIVSTRDFRATLGASVRLGAELPIDGRPSAMVLSPDERTLWVALPELGQLARMAIEGDDLGAPVMLDLRADIPAPVDLRVLDPSQLPPDYQLACDGTTLLDPPLVAPRDTSAATGTPRPWGLLVDSELGRLLVADAALPIVHVIDLATGMELDPINVGAPTRELVLTPRVPAVFPAWQPAGGDPSEGTWIAAPASERFLYAIDETDGSVLVVDYSDPARGSFGAVLPVDVQGARPVDRVPLAFPAFALEVIASDYDPAALAHCANNDTSSPIDLRGVFVAAGGSDGRVRIVDVYDLDATCRGDTTCRPSPPRTLFDEDDQRVFVRRHRLRIGSFLLQGDDVRAETATWTTGTGGSAMVDETGQTTVPEQVPALTALTCPAGLGRVFPPSASATATYACAVTDPWAATPQSFQLAYQGVIPGTASTGGNLVAGEAAIESRLDFCDRGVLGSEDVPTTGYLAGYAGDVLAITGALPPSTDEDADCVALIGGDDPEAILFPIARALTRDPGVGYAGRLELDLSAPGDGARFEEVRRCFPELLTFEVRSGQGSYVVQSTREGMIHGIVRGAGDRCEVPASELELPHGRAFFERTYASPVLALHLGARPVAPDGSRLDLAITDVPATIAIDVSLQGSTELPSLLSELRWSAIDARLYAVEQARRGLVPITVRPLEVLAGFQ